MADSSYAYNYDFNDEDQQNLVRFASLPPDKRHYECGWVVFNNICGVLVPGESFPAHLREAHGIFGNDKAKFKCEWVDCGLQMNKESVSLHLLRGSILAQEHLERSLTKEARIGVRDSLVAYTDNMTFSPFHVRRKFQQYTVAASA
ncbi:hypothetical protein EDD15DRAFT_2363689 [Pisolithus albus]|nr:hypothetical protein EDD15DRAFT_2363689 [Pisolithus albus]